MALSKQKIKLVKDILEEADFYPFLCAYSNNDVDKTIDNLAKLINYVLTTDEDLSSKDRKTILNEAVQFKKQGEFLIYSTNSYLDNHIKLFGISPEMRLNTINNQLTLLDHQISYLDAEKSTYFPLYGNIKKAIEEGFTHPKSLYRSILKQPKDDKQPVLVGESEATYYSSILQRRLKNVPEEFAKTGANIAKKILKDIIGKDITLYFLPTGQEYEDDEIYSHISPLKLRSIRIPSRYSLIMTCAKNKGLKNDTKLSIDTGKEYVRHEKKTKEYSSLSYYNYETITIDENFKYENDQLTGDIAYDIDDLYGRFSKEGTRENLDSLSLDEKIKRIKNSYDIDLTYQDGRYYISNGRHRVLFLLHYYLSNYQTCDTELLKRMLKDSTTIIAYVERKIEDDDINKILIYLEKKYKNIYFIKTNILNNKFNIIIIFKNKAYHIRNKEDLIKYTNYLEKDILMNEFLIGNNSNLELVPYDIVIAKLIEIYKEKILQMDLIDLIVHLKEHPIDINGITIDGNNLNYYALNIAYTSVIHHAELDKYHKVPIGIIETYENKLSEYEKQNRLK